MINSARQACISRRGRSRVQCALFHLLRRDAVRSCSHELVEGVDLGLSIGIKHHRQLNNVNKERPYPGGFRGVAVWGGSTHTARGSRHRSRTAAHKNGLYLTSIINHRTQRKRVTVLEQIPNESAAVSCLPRTAERMLSHLQCKEATQSATGDLRRARAKISSQAFSLQ